MKNLRVFLLFCTIMLSATYASTTVCMERQQAIQQAQQATNNMITRLAIKCAIAFKLQELQQKRYIAQAVSGITYVPCQYQQEPMIAKSISGVPFEYN